MACNFCNVSGAADFSQFLQQSATCKLIIEAQWVVVVLVGAVFLLLLVLIESCIMICYGCYFCYKQTKTRKKYQLQVIAKKGWHFFNCLSLCVCEGNIFLLRN